MCLATILYCFLNDTLHENLELLTLHLTDALLLVPNLLSPGVALISPTILLFPPPPLLSLPRDSLEEG